MKQLNNLIESIANNKKSHFWIFLAVLSVLSLVMLLCFDPVYRGDDFYFHFRRMSALTDSFRDGTFPAYIDYKSVEGYGYLSNPFYSDVILIPFAALSLLTGTLFAYNFMLLTMTILCGVLMYIAIRTIYKNTFAAAISGILFSFCNYRLFDIYPRGALGEALAFTFFPLVLLGLYHIIAGDYKRKWYVLVIAFTLMIYTHVLSSVLTFATTILFLIIYNKPLRKEPKRILYLVLSGVVTLPLVAYFLLPLLEQMASNQFYYQSEAWADPTLYSTSIYWLLLGMTEGLTQPEQFFLPKIGLFVSLGLVFRLFIHGKSKQLKSIDAFVIVGLVYLFITSNLFPWNKFPFSELKLIQFPWRLFAFVSFFFAIAGGHYLSQTVKTNKRKFVAFGGIIVFALLVIAGDAQNYKRVFYPERQALEAPNLVNNYLGGGREYLPSKTAAEALEMRGEKVIADSDNTQISNFTRNGRFTSFDVTTTGSDKLELPLIYYKGYKVTLDNKDLPISESDKGLIQVPIDQSGRVEAYYKGTAIQYVSFAITMISILVLCFYLCIAEKRRKRTIAHKN